MSALWAIACYFNPAGYRTRLRNYRWFRRHLAAPLITVELSFNGSFELAEEDANILVQLDEGDILFQKERLLNVALTHLPPECTSVVWIDGDVLFANADWMERTRAGLEKYAILQPFDERFDLGRNDTPASIPGWNKPPDRISLMEYVSRQGLDREWFLRNSMALRPAPAWGLAWAARRELLDRHGFYDGCVLAGGDMAIFCAAIGAPEAGLILERMNQSSLRHYCEWARPFSRSVDGRVGHVPGKLFHAWHGEIARRRYGRVQHELRDLDFNPFTDLALTGQGTWRWATDKPQLHAHVRGYFWSRDEDGEESAA